LQLTIIADAINAINNESLSRLVEEDGFFRFDNEHSNINKIEESISERHAQWLAAACTASGDSAYDSLSLCADPNGTVYSELYKVVTTKTANFVGRPYSTKGVAIQSQIFCDTITKVRTCRHNK
jgi:hypothetical protein